MSAQNEPLQTRRQPVHAMVIAANFPPDASVGTMRTLRLVRQLIEDRWSVDVITSAPERYRAGTVVDPALLDKVPPTASLTRARAWRPFERLVAWLRPRRRPEPRSGALPAMANDVSPEPTPAVSRSSWAIAAVRACLALPDREVSWIVPAAVASRRRAQLHCPDVIYSSGPPFSAHFVAALLARLTKRPWVADFRDPWARAPWREDRFAFERKAWSILERAIVTRADAILFVTETNRRDFAEHYGESLAYRFHVVPNGCDTADFAELVRHRRSSADRFVLLHAGSLYGARDPSPLLNALARTIAEGQIDRTRFCVRFVGRVGVHGISLPDVVRELALGDVVEFVNHMPRRDVLQEMVDASALLIVQPVTTVSVPAKLYEYMAAGRPVLALAEPGGETADLVRQSRAGLAVPADDEVAIGDALVSLIKGAHQFVPVDPVNYDGARRARATGRILAEIATQHAQRCRVTRGKTVTERATQPEVTRS